MSISNFFSRFTFADADSRLNAQRAYTSLLQRARAGFLVVGPPGSGKTHLVESMIRLAGKRGDVRVSTWPANAPDMSKLLDREVESDFIVFDNVGRSPSGRRAEHLAAFLTTPVWRHCKLGSQEMLKTTPKAVVFVVGNSEIALPADLARRMSVIRLAAPTMAQQFRRIEERARALLPKAVLPQLRVSERESFSLLDEFAKSAMQGIVNHVLFDQHFEDVFLRGCKTDFEREAKAAGLPEFCASIAYDVAEEMMKERARRTPKYIIDGGLKP